MDLTQVRSEEPLLRQPIPRSSISCFHWLSIISFVLLLLATIILALLHFQIIPTPGNSNQDGFGFPDVVQIKTYLDAPEAQTMDHQRPAAHLRGRVKDGSIVWQYSVRNFFKSQDFTIEQNSLKIPKSGLYLVYTQVVFTGRDCKTIQATDLTHKVMHKSPFSDTPQTILTSTKTVCMVPSGSIWTQPIYQGGIFQLDKDDILSTQTSNVDLLNSKDGQIYFGILAI